MSGVSTFPLLGTSTPTRVVCTSSSRPVSPYAGQEIFETDTGKTYTYISGAWVLTDGRIVCTSSTRPSSPYQGQEIYETDTGRVYVRSGSAWVWRSSDNGEETAAFRYFPTLTTDYSSGSLGIWVTIGSVDVPPWATRAIVDMSITGQYAVGGTTYVNYTSRIGSDRGGGTGQNRQVTGRENSVSWTSAITLTSTGSKSIYCEAIISYGTIPVRADGATLFFAAVRFIP